MVESRYPRLAALILSATVTTAHAQSLPAPPPPEDPQGSDAVAPLPTAVAPVAPVGPVAPPFGFNPGLPPPPLGVSTAPPPSPLVRSRFRSGQALYGVGTAVGLIGSGLTVASIVVTSVYGLDTSAGQSNAQIGPALAYGGSGATGAGFILATTGIGLQHSALALAGVDPGRGMYAAGTLFGILGLCGIGTSYFFGLTNYVDHSTAIAFGSSIAATALLTVGGLLYFSDATRLGQVYRRLTTF